MRNPNNRFVDQGHTDTFGTDEFNFDLSQRRALAVVRWLVSSLHLDVTRVEAVGMGKTKLLVPGGSIEEQALNRLGNGSAPPALNRPGETGCRNQRRTRNGTSAREVVTWIFRWLVFAELLVLFGIAYVKIGGLLITQTNLPTIFRGHDQKHNMKRAGDAAGPASGLQPGRSPGR